MSDQEGGAGASISRRGLFEAASAIAMLGLVPAWAPSAAQAAESYDVIVVGSGAAGSVAALFAHEKGARVLVLEKSVSAGGTSAKSGGNYWIPNHFGLRERGLSDTRDGFMRYAVRSAYRNQYDAQDPTLGIPEDIYRLIETFYDNGSVMVDRLSAMGALKSQMFLIGDKSFADYYGDLPEDERPMFRVLSPVAREAGGSIAGDELMSQLHAALRARDIEIRLESQVVDVVLEGGRVVGVELKDADGKSQRIGASRGVVFASGGYAHNHDLLARFQEGPVFGACAAPTATGDIIPIAYHVGAKLANVGGAWRGPAILDQAASNLSVPVAVFGVSADSALFVNLQGHRGMNERRTYHDRSRAMYRYDADTNSYPNLIQVIIYDRRGAEGFAGTFPFPPKPDGIDYMIRGDDLPQLVDNIRARLNKLKDIAANAQISDDFLENLRESISRFNEFARAGVDKDFARGTGVGETFDLVPEASGPRMPSPSMYPVSDVGPYYAIIQGAGVLDTNGGPVIDTSARIVDYAGQPIAGLYGAGNCIASPSGNAYWAAGCTLGLAMTFGMIAGEAVAGAAAARG